MGTSSHLNCCSVAGLALSLFSASVCRAVEIPKPFVNVPKPAIPRPNVVVPKPNIVVNVPKPVVNVPKPTVTVNVPKLAVVVPKVDVPKPAVAVTVVPKVETPRPVVAAPKVDLPRSAGPQTVVNIPKSSAPPAVTDVPKQVAPSVQATTPVVSNPAAGAPVAQPNVKLETPPKTSGPVNPPVPPVGTPKSVKDGNLPKTAAPVLSPANPMVGNPKEPGIASGPPKAAEPLNSSTTVSAAPKHEAGALPAKNAVTVPSASSPPKQADSAKLLILAPGSKPRSSDAYGGAGSGSAGSAVSSNAGGAATAGSISSNASSGSSAVSPSASAATPATAKVGVAKSDSESAQAKTSTTHNALSASSSSGGSAAKSSSGSSQSTNNGMKPATAAVVEGNSGGATAFNEAVACKSPNCGTTPKSSSSSGGTSVAPQQGTGAAQQIAGTQPANATGSSVSPFPKYDVNGQCPTSQVGQVYVDSAYLTDVKTPRYVYDPKPGCISGGCFRTIYPPATGWPVGSSSISATVPNVAPSSLPQTTSGLSARTLATPAGAQGAASGFYEPYEERPILTWRAGDPIRPTPVAPDFGGGSGHSRMPDVNGGDVLPRSPQMPLEQSVITGPDGQSMKVTNNIDGTYTVQTGTGAVQINVDQMNKVLSGDYSPLKSGANGAAQGQQQAGRTGQQGGDGSGGESGAGPASSSASTKAPSPGSKYDPAYDESGQYGPHQMQEAMYDNYGARLPICDPGVCIDPRTGMITPEGRRVQMINSDIKNRER